MRIKILGIGHSMRGDDEVGLDAAIPRAVEMINEILGELLESGRKRLIDKIFKLLGIR